MVNCTIDLICSQSRLLAFFMPQGGEWIVILVIGLLLFGRRLPEVGRSLGKGIVEFKKGIKGLEDDIDEESSKPSSRISDAPRAELPRAKETVSQSREPADDRDRQREGDRYAASEQRREE